MYRLPVTILGATGLLLCFSTWPSDSLHSLEQAVAGEEASSKGPAISPAPSEDKNTPQSARAQASPAPGSNPQSSSSPPFSITEDLQRIQALRDQGMITPEVYEQKRSDLEQIKGLLEQNLISSEIYTEKRRAILGEASPGADSPPRSSPQPRLPAADRLVELKALLDRNLITPEEYKQKRESILNEL